MLFTLMENEQILHLGPIYWNQRMFQSVLKDELDIDFTLPANNDQVIVINSNFKILPAELVYPTTHNPKIEQFAGPFWTVSNNVATGTFTNAPKPIDAVKNELKAIVAQNRWEAEVSGITVNVQSQDVFVTTARGVRDMFLQALQTMGPSDTKLWKFNDIWLTLTKTDLELIVNAIITHIQTKFAWEQSTVAAIDAANDLTQLDAIVLTV